MNRLIVFAVILLFESVTAVLAAATCRLVCRGRRPGWYLALPGALGAASLAIFFSERNGSLFEVIHPNDDGHWGHLIESEADVRWQFFVLLGIAMIPAFLAVAHRRKIFSDREQARKSFLVMGGWLLALARLLLHFRNDRVTLDPDRWVYPETTTHVIFSTMILLACACAATWLVVRHFHRSFPRLRQSLPQIVVALILVFAASGWLLRFRQRDTYYCEACSTRRLVYQWRFGWWYHASVPLEPAQEYIQASHLAEDFFPVDHRHTWEIRFSSCDRFGGRTPTGWASSPVMPLNAEFLSQYEWDPLFRQFLAAKLQNGSLTSPNVIALVAARGPQEHSPLHEQAGALLKEFHGWQNLSVPPVRKTPRHPAGGSFTVSQ